MRISAAVIAGGRSRRMGRDKAGLPAPPYRTLLERQAAILAAIAPREILVSARANAKLVRTSHLRLVVDDGSAGPLGGLVAILQAIRTARVLVLAVDLARMNAGLLRRITGALPDDERIGLVPRTAHGPEPLAALWPRSMLPLAQAQLDSRENFALRTLVHHGVEAGLLRWFDIAPWDLRAFTNWNHPRDIRA